MAAKQPLIVVNAKMYKHFAIVTVALTLFIALMADGEKRDAIAEQAAEVQAYAEKPKSNTPTLVIKNSSVTNSNDLGGFYSGGAPGILTPDGGFDSSLGGNPQLLRNLVAAVTDAELARLGISRENFMAMTSKEQEAVLARLNGGKSPVTSLERVEQVSNQSLQRSGRQGRSADF